MPNRINYEFLSRLEGGSRTKGYVPLPESEAKSIDQAVKTAHIGKLRTRYPLCTSVHCWMQSGWLGYGNGAHL